MNEELIAKHVEATKEYIKAYEFKNEMCNLGGQLYPPYPQLAEAWRRYKKAVIDYCDSSVATFGNEPHGLRDSVSSIK